MIDRTAGLWQFGRLWEYGALEKAFGEWTPAAGNVREDSPFWKARSLFFSYRFKEVLALEADLKPFMQEIPEIWGLLGHAHIRAEQDRKPFKLNLLAWKTGLSYFEKGLNLFPRNRILEYDGARARAVIDGRGILDYTVPESWIDRYLTAYFWLFLVYSPLIPDAKRDAGGVFASGRLPHSLVSLAASLMNDASNEMEKKEALLLACDLLEFKGDYEGILSVIDSDSRWNADPEFLGRKGLAYLDNDDYSFVEIEPEAARLFVQALELDPLNPVRYEHLVRLYLALDEYDIARTYLKMGKSRNFGRGRDHEGLLFAEGILATAENLNADTGDTILSDGIQLLEKAVRIHPYRWESYDSLSTAYAAAGDYGRALRSYRRLLKLKPWRKEYFLGLAELLLRSPGEQEEHTTRVKRLREAVISVAIYQKVNQDSEYAAGLGISALAKLYNEELSHGLEGKDSPGQAHQKTAGIKKEIDGFIESLNENILSSVDFLAYTGFELYINNVQEPGVHFLARALALDPVHPYALQSYGVVLEEKGIIDSDAAVLKEAYRHFKLACEYEHDPYTKGRYLLYLVDFLPTAGLENLAAGLLSQGIGEDLPVPELYERMADQHLENGKDDLAFDVLEKGQARFPDDPDLAFRLSRELIRDGRFVQGIQILEDLLARHPMEAVYWNQLGISYIEWTNGLIKPEEAEAGYRKGTAAFQKAVELVPDSPLFLGNYGDALRLLGEFEKAGEYLEQAIAISPEDGFYYYVLAKVFWEKGLGQAEDRQEAFVRSSEELFFKAQALDPDEVRYFRDMGDMYYHFGYFVDAIDLYRKALELDSESSALYDAVGLCHYQMREFSEAIEWFSLGLEYARDSGEILNSIGLCYYEQDMYEEAQQFFKRASDTDPSNSVFLDNVFLAQYKLLGYHDNAGG
ncbi:MAG: tetratricopeptide repeat protein [Spirochaetales bacterium]|nr:tetratricopeptide repeat protein [Spirochaetales bacterium]